MNTEELIKPIQVETATYHLRDAEEDDYHDFVVVAAYPRVDPPEVTLGHIDIVGQHFGFIAATYGNLPIAFGSVGLRAIASFVDAVNYAEGKANYEDDIYAKSK